MKKIIALAGCLVLGTALLAGCGSSGAASTTAAETTSKEAAGDATDFTNFTTITTSDLFDQDVTFDLLPDGYNYSVSEHPGTVERLHYTTDAYEDGVTYEKYVTVYLPYGYDPDDTETKYNVLYFQHGNSGSPNELWDHETDTIHAKNMIDNMFDPDHQLMEPCIIICPTYYFEVEEEGYTTKDGSGPAGDGRYDGIVGNYYLEVIEDLIPQIESRYNVYCTDFSEEGIKASRSHRAWAGYSRGGFCTWYMFHHDLEYFEYWMPLSGVCATDGSSLDEGMSTDPADAYAYIKETVDAHPDLNWFIFTTLGGETDATTITGWVDQVQYFYQQTDTFHFGLDPMTCNFYAARNEFAHNDLYMPYSLYNARNILFQPQS